MMWMVWVVTLVLTILSWHLIEKKALRHKDYTKLVGGKK